MKLVDIRTRELPHAPANSSQTRAGFHFEVSKISTQEAKQLPHYELEAGKARESKGLLRGWKQLSFSFTTFFGVKRYRVRTWFILH